MSAVLEPITPEWVKDKVRPLFSLVLRCEEMRDEVYLSNHSLGRPLDQMANDVQCALDRWYARMDHNWYDEDGWLAEMDAWRGNTARLVGLPRHDCVVPKVSAGQGLRAVLNALLGQRPINIVTTTGEFDSVDFILKAYESRGVAKVTWVKPSLKDGGVPLFSADDIVAAIGKATDLVVFSRVFFMTAQILDGFERVVAAAHEHGALALADLFHAAGVIPLKMEQEGYDFAIGGSYKYLRGGPGACWLAIHPRTFEKGLRTLDTGWFAKVGTLDFERPQQQLFKEGGDGWLESTPAIVLPYQAKSGLEFVLNNGVDRLRKYSLSRLAAMRETFISSGVDMHTPDGPERFGAFALMPHPKAAELRQALLEKGVNADARQGFVRFGPDLLSTDEEFERTAKTVESLL